MNIENEIAELKNLIEEAIEDRKSALVELTNLTLDDPTENSQDILDLAQAAYLHLEDARRFKVELRALRDSIRPKCSCNCH